MKTIIITLLLTSLTITTVSSQEPSPPTPPPTPPPTINTGTNSWYYKYEKSGCAQDCLTSAGEDCGGVAANWQTNYLFTTLEECCTTSTNLILELCISNSRFSIGDYTGSNLYYVSVDSKCDKDCAVGSGDCGGIITSSSVELYNSIEECCTGSGSASISNVQYCVSSSDPSSTGTGLFFKSSNDGYCIQDLDEANCPSSKTCQRATQTNKLYTTITECCALDVSWVNPTYCESSGFPTNKWYPNYGEGICKKDCDTGGDECELSNSGVIKYYDEAALCCSTELQSELYCTDYSLGQEPSGSLAWYVTWENGVQKCAQDCPVDAGGGGPCGGLITVGVVTYESIDACCETALSTMRLEECQAVSNGEEYLGTEQYYAESSRCVQDCPETNTPSGGGVCGGLLSWGQSYATVGECCEAKLPSLDAAYCADNSLATPVGTGKFVTSAEGHCTQDATTCSGSQLCDRASSGDVLYDTLAACCESRAWVQLDYCTSRSVGGYSDKWYKSSNGICAQDKEGTEVPNMSTELFADATTCCNAINPEDEDCVTLSEGGEVPGVDGSGEWYLATYPNNNRCTKDCVDEGDADCGGLVSWGETYASVEECCEKRLPNMVTGLCLSNSQESVGDYTGSDQYYPGADRCLKDCAEESADDCGGIITDLTQATLYPDISSCCASIVWLNDDICASNSDPTSTGTGLYFALAQEGYCIQDDCTSGDDSCIRATTTDTLHATIEACCSSSLPNVNEVYCTGGGEPTNLWFKDDGNTFCIQDVDTDSDINGASTTFYESVELCCETSSSLLDYCIATSNNEEYIGTNEFYVQGSRCIQDCPESDTCGGVILDSTTLYETVELCCASIGWLDPNFCIAYPNPSEMYYSAASNCVKDSDNCSGDEVCERASAGVKLYPDPTTCCSSMPYISSELCVASTEGVYTNKWFASTSVCSKHCDNGQECEEVPNNSVTLYLTAQACCSSLTWLPLQNCTTASEEGGTLTLQQATLEETSDVQEALPPPPPISRPTLRPSNEPTSNPTSQPIVGTATADLKAAYIYQQSSHQQYKGEEQVVDNELDVSSVVSGAAIDIDIPVDDTLESPIIEESSATADSFISCSFLGILVVVWFI